MKTKEALIAEVQAAFRGVVLGSGVSLHETVAVDNYAGEAERARIRSADEQTDWSRLLADPDLGRLGYVGGPPFLDAEGMRFHLPAYLMLALTKFDAPEADPALDTLMWALTGREAPNEGRFALLNRAQRLCTGRVLDHLRSVHELESRELDEAIEKWMAEDVAGGRQAATAVERPAAPTTDGEGEP